MNQKVAYRLRQLRRLEVESAAALLRAQEHLAEIRWQRVALEAIAR